ncbi:MAG: tRNA dihydrouridine synthase DusB [Fusobacteriota bacterium]
MKKNIKIYIAPMAGVTDYSYRRILKEFNPDLIFTEMISSNAVIMNNKRTHEQMLNFLEGDAVQIFGKDIDIMLKTAKYIQSLGIKHIDVNAGCPVKKVIKNGYGSALLGDFEHLEKLMRTLKKELDVPVSLKIRIGYKEHKNTLKIAKMAENIGLEFLTIHGRTQSQMYTGEADWKIIKQIKEKVSIPIVGNGDIFTAEDAYEKVKYSNVDAIMLARGIMGNPWLIKQIKEKFKYGEIRTQVTASNKIDMAIKHLEYAVEEKGEEFGVREMRKHISWYLKGLKNSRSIKDIINQKEKLQEVKKILNEYKNELKIQGKK